VPLLNTRELTSVSDESIYFVLSTVRRIEEFFYPAMYNNRDIVAKILRAEFCTTVHDLFVHWSSVLQFPSYFGWNWPAFSECLTDLEWLDGEGYILLITSANLLLWRDRDELQTFWRILMNAASYWKQPNFSETISGPNGSTILKRPTAFPFSVILQADPANEQGALDMLTLAGIQPQIRTAGN
jgi:Barstar (barnase inhibitor)